MVLTLFLTALGGILIGVGFCKTYNWITGRDPHKVYRDFLETRGTQTNQVITQSNRIIK